MGSECSIDSEKIDSKDKATECRATRTALLDAAFPRSAPDKLAQLTVGDSKPATADRAQSQKLWNAEDASAATIAAFNARDIPQATKLLKELEIETKKHGPDYWRHAIEFVNLKVDRENLSMKDMGLILGTKDGKLITTSKDFNSKQFRSPDNPEEPTSQVAFWQSYPRASVLNDYRGLSEVRRINQYIDDANEAPKWYVSPDQMNIHNPTAPIIDAFKAGDIKGATALLNDEQIKNSHTERQMWFRQLAAINANLQFKDSGIPGLPDTGLVLGVNDKGQLLTVTENFSKVQMHSLSDPTQIELEGKSDPVFTAQITALREAMQEADNARVDKLGPGLHRLSITVPQEGELRPMDVYVGKTVDPSKLAPTFILLHAAGPPPERDIMANETGAREWADKHGAIIIEGLATERTQPVGKLGGIALLGGSNMDYHAWTTPGSGLNETIKTHKDEDYLTAGVQQLKDKIPIDPNRIYLFVFSDGDTVTKQAAVALNAAGAIVVHGGISNTFKLPDNAGIAFIAVNDEQDVVLPRACGSLYNGAAGNWEARWPKLANACPTKNFDEFALANGCTGDPKVTTRPGGEIRRTEFTADKCTTNRPVIEFNLLNGGGHGVPSPQGTWAFGPMAGKLLGIGSKYNKFNAFRITAEEIMQYSKAD